MAYPVSRPRVRTPLSRAALSSAAGASCACDTQAETPETGLGTPRIGFAAMRFGLPLLFAAWLVAAGAALLMFWH